MDYLPLEEFNRKFWIQVNRPVRKKNQVSFVAVVK